MTRYAELQTLSNFSFLQGASHPWELVLTAAALGLEAIGLTDRNSLAGVVRAWSALQDLPPGENRLRVLTGCRLDLNDGSPSLLCYPTDREAYGRLTRLLTLGQRRTVKGQCQISREDVLAHAEGQLFLVVPPARLDETFRRDLEHLGGELSGSIWLAAARAYGPRDLHRLSQLAALATSTRVPMVAVGDVLYHRPDRRPLQDVVTCIREGCTLEEAGLRLQAHAERHLKSPAEMARLFARFPGVVERSTEIARRISFDLSDLKYEYPGEPVPEGKTAMGHLTDLTWQGAAWRFPDGIRPQDARKIEHELDLIERCQFPNYFLTVHDIVRWARDQDILCQGRGSAANSLVCFCLGITSVDPTRKNHDLLFSRFISEQRGEPPDIDVDFEHERREEVMQYIYRRYGRERAAIVATVIHYRPKMAIRQVGKVLGLTEDVTGALAGMVWGYGGSSLPEEHIRQAGMDPDNPDIHRAVTLASELLGFPRHLSQHVGGFVLTRRRLDETVPIGNAVMKDRTFIMWDKDDIDALGLMKVDVLALGMLTALKRGLDMIPPEDGGKITDIAEIPPEVPEVYDMLCRADSVGVFQVESRAQMSMLPRLKPREFYDLVIEVAIVRPGPIQGNMVHPYLRRRSGQEPVSFPRPSPPHPQDELEQILKKTLGVPLFQEQAMRIAIEGAQFSDNDADGLRRAMATFRNHGSVNRYKDRFLSGMIERGYEEAFAQDCYSQIEGFGSYGFPESHAISFALLVYASAWMKWRWPDAFCAALINSQPMGFYSPAQLVRDAREHGVEVRPADLMASDWDCTLEDRPGHRLRAVRLGLRQIKGLSEAEARALVQSRSAGASSLETLARTPGLTRRSLELLAEADALAGLGYGRREALWAVKGLDLRTGTETPLISGARGQETQVQLPLMSLPVQVREDYRTTRLSLKAHPCSFFRPHLTSLGTVTAASLAGLKNGRRTGVGGLVLNRQRPSTANGVVFMTLEDETGAANIVIWKDVFTANRRTVMGASILAVHGQLQNLEGVVHLVAQRFTDLSHMTARLQDETSGPGPERLQPSRDFH